MIKRLAAFLGLSLAVALLGLWFLSRTETSFNGPHFNRNLNAIWVGHKWVGEAIPESEIADLARSLAAHGIKYLYVHVGPLETDGTIPPDRHPYAARFVRIARETEPDLVLLAWIGQVEKAGGGILDLSYPDVRENIAKSAALFVGPLGFDGIHYDIEPILDGNQNYLTLLNLTRRTNGNTFLSVAAHKWVPNAFIPPVIRLVYQPGAVWTDSYFRQVDGLVDQIAIMSYDTAMPWASAYTLFMKLETTGALNAVSSAKVLMGVPTYHQPSWAHVPEAENMQTALEGVTAGLNSAKATHTFSGVAIYPLWETSDEEWGVYRRLWLGSN